MNFKIKSVLIVGGGSSGWFTASALCRLCPHIDVTLVESKNVPTIGVGESTLGFITSFFNGLGMKDEEWMPACNATYKASIKFTDFYKKGEVFHYPFGEEDLSHTKFGRDDWFMKKWLYPETPIEDFCRSMFVHMPLIEGNKIYKNEDRSIPYYSFARDTAYQLDATLLAHWMRDNLCLPTGMKHILDDVTNVNLDELGWISSVDTKEGGKLEADLYIDCTGFKSLLLEKSLKIPFISYRDDLINDKAWATHKPFKDKNKEMELWGNNTAIENGWVWNVPLWTNIGTGYVFSSEFVSDDDALVEFQKHIGYGDELDYNLVHIKNGRHSKCWTKNCLAIGLSNGFIEPLESTGLMLTHETINNLIMTLQNREGYVNQFDRDCLNKRMAKQTDDFSKFVALHFIGSERTETEYWKYYSQEKENDFIDEFYEAGFETLFNTKLNSLTSERLSLGTLCIMVGMHLDLYTDYTRERLRFVFLKWNDYNKCVFEEEIQSSLDYWQGRTVMVQQIADESPTNYEYLRDNYDYNE